MGDPPAETTVIAHNPPVHADPPATGHAATLEAHLARAADRAGGDRHRPVRPARRLRARAARVARLRHTDRVAFSVLGAALHAAAGDANIARAAVGAVVELRPRR